MTVAKMNDLTDEDRDHISVAVAQVILAGHTSRREREAIYRAGLAAGRERAIDDCASLLSMSRSEAQLVAGEMSAQEWRTVSAILVNRVFAIRALPK